MDKQLEKYLLEVDKRLKYMPASEKADILGELKSSFTDMLADGKTQEEILRGMGPAKRWLPIILGMRSRVSGSFHGSGCGCISGFIRWRLLRGWQRSRRLRHLLFHFSSHRLSV